MLGWAYLAQALTIYSGLWLCPWRDMASLACLGLQGILMWPSWCLFLPFLCKLASLWQMGRQNVSSCFSSAILLGSASEVGP